MLNVTQAFELLIKALAGRKLPCENGPAREVPVDEFMLMGQRPNWLGFKHRDTRNYIELHKNNDKWELFIPVTNQAYRRGWFDTCEIPSHLLQGVK